MASSHRLLHLTSTFSLSTREVEGNEPFEGDLTSVVHLLSGKLWLSSYKGVFEIDADGHYSKVPALNSLAEVNALTQTPDGTVWIGFEKGLSTYLGGNVATYLPSNNVTQLTVDPDGSLWVAHNRASVFIGVSLLELYSGASGIVHLRGHDPGAWEVLSPSNDSLPNQDISSLAVTKNALWVGEKVGLFRIQRSHWNILPLPQARAEIVQGFGRSSDGALWCLTNLRLRVLTSSGTIITPLQVKS